MSSVLTTEQREQAGSDSYNRFEYQVLTGLLRKCLNVKRKKVAVIKSLSWDLFSTII